MGNIIDGDTFDILESKRRRVRLYAIDCPEDGQDWGDTAKAGLVKLIGGSRPVYLEVHGIDTYGRVLATVHIKEGSGLINVNEKMVVRGHAWVMRKYYKDLSQKRQIKLNQIERWVRHKRVGLWKSDNPTPPWLWRKEKCNS